MKKSLAKTCAVALSLILAITFLSACLARQEEEDYEPDVYAGESVYGNGEEYYGGLRSIPHVGAAHETHRIVHALPLPGEGWSIESIQIIGYSLVIFYEIDFDPEEISYFELFTFFEENAIYYFNLIENLAALTFSLLNSEENLPPFVSWRVTRAEAMAAAQEAQNEPDQGEGHIENNDEGEAESATVFWFLNGRNIDDAELARLVAENEIPQSVTHLNLQFNNITDIEPLAGLPNLVWIDLWGNEISDLSPLANLSNLNELIILQNQITNLAPLASLPALTRLSVDFVYAYSQEITVDINPLTQIETLYHLELGGADAIYGIAYIADIPNLRSLSLWGVDFNLLNALPVFASGGLNGLTHLSLRGQGISDITALAGLANLVELDLTGNGISDIT
ncbi:MAG: leucine-rich repeat domain-containing protein, partial [Defluviitaleaceae bacterium]|nr:leucine-rich repeat domain-containing protein [Defluviitaleaceae bacterium]